MNKLNPFLALTVSLPLIFLSNLSDTEAVALVANLCKTSLIKATAISISALYLFYHSYYLMFYQKIYLIELF